MINVKKEYIQYAAIVLVIVVAFIILSKQAERAKAKKEIQDSKDGVFRPDPYAEAVYVDLNGGWFSVSDTFAYTDIVNLSDDQIREVWFYYENNLKNKKDNYYKGKSMREAIDSASFYLMGTVAASEMLKKKLKEMNLS